jgi:hypothetical protein
LARIVLLCVLAGLTARNACAGSRDPARAGRKRSVGNFVGPRRPGRIGERPHGNEDR